MKIPGCPVPQMSNQAVPPSWCSCAEGGGLSASGVQRQPLEKGKGQVSPTESLLLSQGTGHPPIREEQME